MPGGDVEQLGISALNRFSCYLVEKFKFCCLIFICRKRQYKHCSHNHPLQKNRTSQLIMLFVVHFFIKTISKFDTKIKLTINFSKALDSVWHPAFSINFFQLVSLLAFLIGLNLFWQARLCGFSKSQKSLLLSCRDISPIFILNSLLFFSCDYEYFCVSTFFRRLFSFC